MTTYTKKIALVAHDHKKSALLDWASQHREILSRHHLFATGTTGRLLEDHLKLPIRKLQSGPLGGDQQIGAMIATGDIDFLVFFWDPLEPLPHDPDIKALLRLAVVWNIPMACNRITADYLFASPLLEQELPDTRPDYDAYRQRPIQIE
ncbi:methylglyoxal synthase [Catalinimonas alkaloidigena]|uniref:Methylglyoxal synthase n=1 Tax=Catalinimonas alkaloidigena TaxID=1075417 RepID=A0A1G9B0S2_9BACT|nr:methylglyoxal synthase [Catalinimonas alkaloidigena]SDK33171.1 methylglyoxal synthase [Catalinimonas alkaloidigena]